MIRNRFDFWGSGDSPEDSGRLVPMSDKWRTLLLLATYQAENTGKQDRKEKGKGHGGDETSKPGHMLAMSFHLLDDKMSKREVGGF